MIRVSRADDRLKGDLGRTLYDRKNNEPVQVIVDDQLRGKALEKVLAHEFGHVLKLILKRLPIDHLRDELEPMYHLLNRGRNYRPGDELKGRLVAATKVMR